MPAPAKAARRPGSQRTALRRPGRPVARRDVPRGSSDGGKDAAPVRQARTHEFRRAAVLAAAGSVFARDGLSGATMRAIAGAAGYTVGALYFYYPGKEAIYADLLGQSLDRLRMAVAGAIKAVDAGPDRAEARVRAGLWGFLGHYRSHPRELDLGLYLFRGLGPHGLSPALDRELNSRLIAVLRRISGTMTELGRLDPLAAHGETVAAFATMLGLLVAERTGRLKILDATADDVMTRYLDALVARLRAAA
ncbi:MAG: TetR/AcrR family transcriptional regulator [Alphaproteobacteria bacterium]|nr:TetR/AcrR family transcriptional regulator [Alphaproteobacteria bacterium]